jgi:hypothetical protein
MGLSVDDRAEILNLLGVYNYAIDFGDAAGWAACFTEHGTFESPGTLAKGRAELVAFAEGFSKQIPGARHWVNNIVVDGGGDSATTKAYLILYTVGGEGGPKTVATGLYNDTLTKDNGAWKFTSRKVTVDA